MWIRTEKSAATASAELLALRATLAAEAQKREALAKEKEKAEGDLRDSKKGLELSTSALQQRAEREKERAAEAGIFLVSCPCYVLSRSPCFHCFLSPLVLSPRFSHPLLLLERKAAALAAETAALRDLLAAEAQKREALAKEKEKAEGELRDSKKGLELSTSALQKREKERAAAVEAEKKRQEEEK